MKCTAGTAPTAADASAAAIRWAGTLGGGPNDQGRPSRQTCWAVWHEDLAAFEVLKPKGDSLRSMGTTWRGRTMLHAEEGLWLAERGMLAVHPFPGAGVSAPVPVAKISLTTLTAGTSAENENTIRIRGGEMKKYWRKKAGEEEGGTEEKKAQEGRNKTAPHDNVGAGVGNTTGSLMQEEKEEEVKDETEKDETEKEGEQRDQAEGGGGATGSSISTSGWQVIPPSRNTASEDCLPEAKMSSHDSPPTGTLAGDPGRVLDLREDGGLAWEVQGHSCQRRAGRKRGRAESGEGGKERAIAPVLPVPVGILHGTILSRAGVPWECYRAYAELKRRSHVVRRRPEDTVGHDDNAPRAAPLSWFGPTPFSVRRRRRGRTTTNNSNNREKHFSADAGIDATSSSSSYSSSSSSFGTLSVPVTFHIYNNRLSSFSSSTHPVYSSPPPPSSSFRRRDPGPPDALLVVCRFEDPMPDHRSLVALAERHAGMMIAAKSTATNTKITATETTARATTATTATATTATVVTKAAAAVSMIGGTGTSTQRTRGTSSRRGGAEGSCPDPERTPSSPGGGRSRCYTIEGREAAVVGSAGGDERDVSLPGAGRAWVRRREEFPSNGQQRGGGAGDDDKFPSDPRQGHGGGRVRGSGGVPVMVQGVGGSEGVLPSREQGELEQNRVLGESVSGESEGNGDGGGWREGFTAENGGRSRTGLLSAAARGLCSPGIKLAVVSGEAGVQLFDVGLHDADEVANPPVFPQ